MIPNISPTVVKPDISYLTDVIDRIAQGELRVPRFQRPFVWKLEAMIALFDSIYRGYPIGSLLFWKTGDKKYQTFEKVGPYSIPNDNPLPLNYILDGHQRLSTLFGVLSNINNELQEETDNAWQWVIYFDLKEKKFLHLNNNKKNETPLPHYISLKKLLKTIDFIQESNRIINNCGNDARKYIEEAERLLGIIRNYRIAITQIEGGDIDSAVQIFSRLNKMGVKMDDDRMYSALTYKENQFNLSDRIDQIITNLIPYQFDEIERMIIFRVILAASGKNIYTDGKLDLFEQTTDLPEIVDKAERGIIATAKFLHNNLDLPSSNFLPYSLQFLIISEFFRLCPNPSENKLKKLEQWFWVSSFIGMDIVNSSKKVATIEEIRTFAILTDNNVDDFKFEMIDFKEKAQPFPKRYNLVNARTKSFVLFLSSLKPKVLDDENEKELDCKRVLSQNGYKAIQYIKNFSNRKDLVSNIANRVILDPENTLSKQILKESNSLFSSNRTEILASHAITDAAFIAFQNGKDEEFIELRQKELIRLEKEFLKQKGVVPYDGWSVMDGVNDTDES